VKVSCYTALPPSLPLSLSFLFLSHLKEIVEVVSKTGRGILPARRCLS
jgi:hypothetical protein